MSDTFLAPDDIELAFPSVDHSMNKPLWLVGVNFFPKKLVFTTEWSSPEMSGVFGQWVKLFAGISYLAKQGFNFGPKRGFYIAEMANQDLVGSHTRKLHESSSPSDKLILPEAKSTLMVGTFLGPTGQPFIQSPILGGRKAKWGGGAAASVGLLLQHIERELGGEAWMLRDLVDDFTTYCKHDRSAFENLEANYAVPFAFTEAITTIEWAEIAVASGVVPASMFDDPPESSEEPLSEYVAERDADPEIQEIASKAQATADALPEFGKSRAADIHQTPGPDDYTASVYSYSFEIASLYMKKLAYGAPLDENSAIGEALIPLLVEDEFDVPAWNSAVGTVAARLTVRVAAELAPQERDYLLSFAPQMAQAPGFEDTIASMYAEFLQMYQDEPAGAARHAAASAVQSASDGEISLYDYSETQSWDLIDSAWEAAVDLMLDGLAANDEDGSKIAAMRLAADHWESPG